MMMVGVMMIAGLVVGGSVATEQDPPTAAERFEALKSLAGTWVADMDGDGESDSELVFKVISAGSAVHETMFPGTEHEMVNVFHLDGDDLLMTHYCAAGNQPHMRAMPAGGEDRITFDLTHASNAKEGVPVMGHVVYSIGEETLREEWTATRDGEEMPTRTFELRRKESGEEEHDGAQPEMVEYYVVLLRPAEDRPELPDEELMEIQERHLAHLGAMRERGVMKYAGPFGDRSGGMCIYSGPSLEQVRRLAESDPAVEAGRLEVHVHPWRVPGGLGGDDE